MVAKTFFWLAAGLGSSLIWFTLLLELEREVTWSADTDRLVGTTVALLLTAGSIAAGTIPLRRMTSRPDALRHIVLGFAVLAFGMSGAWGVRAGSDWLALRSWGSWEGSSLERVWQETYPERYAIAASETARRDAAFYALTGTLPWRTADTMSFTPDRPPDAISRQLYRVRTGRYAHEDVIMCVVVARWLHVPMNLELQGSDVGVLVPRTIRVREVLQWAGPGGDEAGWDLVEASVGTD